VFRVLNVNTGELKFIGGFRNGERHGFGVASEENFQVEGLWAKDKISGAVKVRNFQKSLVFVGSANNSDIGDLNFSFGEMHQPIQESYGACRWYQKNGKLKYLGNLKNGKLNSKFGIFYNGNGQIQYMGEFKDNA